MSIDIFTYIAQLPPGINEFITENDDGSYTVYLQASNTREQWELSYKHALNHIKQYDFEKYDVQEIEYLCHMKGGAL